MTFRGPGAHVRIELSLESQHDLEGSGGSENQCFFDVFFRMGLQTLLVSLFVRLFRDLGGPK